MKSYSIKWFSFFFLFSYLLTACGAAVTPPPVRPAAPATDAKTSPVEFVGQLEAINATAWTVSGQVIQVDASTSLDSSLKVGDQVQVSAVVQPDGRIMASRVQIYQQVASADLTQLPTETSLPEITPTPGPLATPVMQETVGTIEQIDGSQWTVSGQVFVVTAQTEIPVPMAVGQVAVVHWYTAPDGSVTVKEITPLAPTPTAIATTSGQGSGGSGGSSGDDNGGNNGGDNGGDNGGGEDDGND